MTRIKKCVVQSGTKATGPGVKNYRMPVLPSATFIKEEIKEEETSDNCFISDEDEETTTPQQGQKLNLTGTFNYLVGIQNKTFI